MKLSEKKQSKFTPHPETTDYIKAVIVDTTEPKDCQTQYGIKKKFRLVYETEVMDEGNDRRFCIWSRGYTLSLNEKSSLRKDLKKIMGRELTTAELEEFDTESMIGMGVKIEVEHDHKDDNTYANITSLKLDKDAPLKASGKYKRIRDREDKADSADSDEADEPAATGWEAVVVHVGKHKGKKLADVDEGGVKILIEKWLPTAKAARNIEDAGLIAALDELAALLGGDDEIPY